MLCYTLVSGISVGRAIPSSESSLFSSSDSTRVAAFLSEGEEQVGGDGGVATVAAFNESMLHSVFNYSNKHTPKTTSE